jgi:hypothetical protein
MQENDEIQLFDTFIRGTSWLLETPYEQVPSREFYLPPSAAPAPMKAPCSARSGPQARTPDEGERGNP